MVAMSQWQRSLPVNVTWQTVPLDELWIPLGYKGESSLEQQWVVSMGLANAPSRPFSHDKRNPPSPLIVPTRYIGESDSRLVGRKAFRLRFDCTPALPLGRSNVETAVEIDSNARRGPRA